MFLFTTHECEYFRVCRVGYVTRLKEKKIQFNCYKRMDAASISIASDVVAKNIFVANLLCLCMSSSYRQSRQHSKWKCVHVFGWCDAFVRWFIHSPRERQVKDGEKCGENWNVALCIWSCVCANKQMQLREFAFFIGERCDALSQRAKTNLLFRTSLDVFSRKRRRDWYREREKRKRREWERMEKVKLEIVWATMLKNTRRLRW